MIRALIYAFAYKSRKNELPLFNFNTICFLLIPRLFADRSQITETWACTNFKINDYAKPSINETSADEYFKI